MHIRPAVASDIPALLDIYNEEVLHGCATLDTRVRSAEEWQLWAQRHSTPRHPLLVAAEEERPAGYATLSPYRPHDAYASTAELSVYVARGCRRRGIGRALAQAVIDYARRQGLIHNIVSVITSENEASAQLHRELGFRYSGRLHNVGVKLGRYLSIDHYELEL